MANQPYQPYQSIFTGVQVDEILTKALQHIDLTQAQYDTMAAAGTLEPKGWYFIFRSEQLQAVYCGTTLIAQRSTGGTSVGFPYTFPIIF